MTDKDKVARKLAAGHYQTDPTIVKIVRCSTGNEDENRPDEPIKLLEVNEATIPSGIVPLQFDAHPSSGIDYPSVIVEVTPTEFQDIEAGQLQLPLGWQMGELFPRPVQSESAGA